MLTGTSSGRRSHLSLTALRQDVAVGGVLTSTVPPANFVAGITHQITFIAHDASGSPIAAGPISTVYTSSNTGIVTVSGTGLVTAIGVGTATVTIQADGWRNVLTYTVSSGAAVVDHVDLTLLSVTLNVGQQASVIATPRDASNNGLPARTVTVASGDVALATVAPASGTSPLTFVITAVANGTVNVTATCETKTIICAVTVQTTVLTGYPYTGAGKLGSRDWSSFADKAALAGLFGVEGGQNTLPPALPVTDFYDLVADPIFGKAVRYNGDPALNPSTSGAPGRVAVHSFSLGVNTKPNIWVRQFVRFDTTWTQRGSNGSGGASYKMMFLRLSPNSGRQASIFNGSRDWTLEFIPNGFSTTDTTVAWDNTLPFSLSNAMAGGDMAPQTQVAAQTRPASEGGNLAAADGDGEWYEIIMHYKVLPGGVEAQGTNARRRYTTGAGTVVDPDTATVAKATSPWAQGKTQGWTINARGGTGGTFPYVQTYAMGINRNQWYDAVAHVYWGPYEVVDGSVNSDPFGVGSIWDGGGGV